jgi:hypothetical protein
VTPGGSFEGGDPLGADMACGDGYCADPEDDCDGNPADDCPQDCEHPCDYGEEDPHLSTTVFPPPPGTLTPLPVSDAEAL